MSPLRIILFIGLGLGLAMTLFSLGAGLRSMADSGSRRSNLFMRWRIASQSLAILCLVGLAYTNNE